LLALFLTGSDAFTHRVHAVDEAHWDAPTPCTEWSVADLVGHLVDEHLWVPPLVDGLDLDSAGKVVAGTRKLPAEGGVGANLAEAWDEAAVGSRDAWTTPGALDRQVHLSRGLTPAREYLGEMIVDLAVHSWDLAAAIGQSAALPDELARYAWEALSPHGPDLSGSGVFGKPVDVPESASVQDRLLGLTGRDPGWRPPA
jgi:uncharacterized protein (TIGR03086 family)